MGVRQDNAIPPRNGEGDRPKGGGGAFNTTSATIRMARRERRSGNLPEVILWRALRQRPGGFKFRRQHPIGPYSLDFACLSARLAIEIDGEVHNRGDQPESDSVRDAHMRGRGFDTIRIPAREVLQSVDMVVIAIVSACRERQTPPPPSTSLRLVPLPVSGR